MRDYDRSWSKSRPDLPDAADDSHLPTPGKVSLVDATLNPSTRRGARPDPGRVPLTRGVVPLPVFRRAADDGAPAADAAAQVRTAQGSSEGRPLPPALQRRLKRRMGPAVDDVRVHDGPAAAQAAGAVRAEAYTVGRDIYFADGAYDPESPRGQQLIAHEVAHAAAPDGARPATAPGEDGELAVSQPGDAEEQRADAMAEGGLGEAFGPQDADDADGDEAQPKAPPVRAPDKTAEKTAAAQPGDKPAIADKPDGEKPAQPKASKLDAVEAERKADMAAARTPPKPARMHVEDDPELPRRAAPVAAKAPPPLVGRARPGEIPFAPIDLAAVMPPLGPEETVDARRATETAILADHEVDRVHANRSIKGFVASGNQQIGALQTLRPSLHRQIEAAERRAIAAVDSAATAQAAAVRAAVSSAIAQAQSAAGAARGQVQGAHGSALSAMSTATAAARARVEAAYKTASDQIRDKETAQRQAVSDRYTTAQGQFRNAGSAAGGRAVAKAGAMAAEYLSHKINRDDSFLEGDVTDRRCEARAQAARDVGDKYREGLVEEAGKQADKLLENKPADLTAVGDIATEVRKSLDETKDESLKGLDDAHKESIAGADASRSQFLGQIDSALAGTLSSLRQHGESQVAALQQQAADARQSIRAQATQITASIDQGLTAAMTGLRRSLDTLVDGLRGKDVPDQAELDPAVTHASEQLTLQIAALRLNLTTSGAQQAQTLTQSGTQSAAGINQAGTAAAAAAHQMAAGAADGMAQTGAAAQTALRQLADGHGKSVDGMAKGAEEAFPKIVEALDKAYTNLAKQFEDGSKKNLDLITDAFDDAVDEDLPPKVRECAEEAASKVEPRWKSVLKILIIILIVIVIAVVLGPMVIGAVAAAATALGAGAAAGAIGLIVGGAIVGAVTGAVTTLADNAMNGRPLFQDFWKNVAMGAVGGALGGGVGGLAGKLGPRLAALGRGGKLANIGIEIVTDAVVDVGVNLMFGEKITLENLGMGAIMGVFMSGVGSTRRMEGLSNRMTAIGEKGGATIVPPPLRRPPRVDVDGAVPTPDAGGDAPTTRAPDGGADAPTPRGDRDAPAPTPAPRPAPTPTRPRGDDDQAPAPAPRPDDDVDAPTPPATGTRPAPDRDPAPDRPADKDPTPDSDDAVDLDAPRDIDAPRPDYTAPVGPGGYTTDAIPLVGRGDPLGPAAARIQPVPGKLDVIVHGDGNTFIVRTSGGEVQLDHRALAGYIRSRGGADREIRLISCEAGSSPNAIAQHLANKLGVKVTAPNDTIWIHPDGSLTVGKNPDVETGGWNSFEPGNRMEVDVAAPGGRPDVDATPSTGDDAVAARSEPQSNGKAKDDGYPASFTIGGKKYDIDAADCPYYYYRDGDGFQLRRKDANGSDPPLRVVKGEDGTPKVEINDGASAPRERFPDSATREDALARLTRDDSSFKAYMEMLESRGLATRDDVLAAMDNPSGATVDDIRHKLKQAFRQKVLDDITMPERVPPMEMEESRQRLAEVTRDLNSSDQGSLTEAWARHWHLPPDVASQIDIPQLPGMKGPRKYDFLEIQDGVATEVKSGSAPLSQHDKDQFADYMKSIREEHAIDGVPVREVVYVLTSADGAQVNAKWLRQMMKEYPELTVHVHDAEGRPHSFKHEDGKEELDAFFGKDTDPDGPDVGPVSAGRQPPPPPPKEPGGTRTPEPEPDKPRQPSRDLDEIYAAAAVADRELLGMCDEIASITGAAHRPPPDGIKGRARAEDKIRDDYGGDASLLCDISRTTLEFESLDDLRRAIAMIEGRAEIVGTKDRFDDPKDSGYRDANLKVRMSNGHVCEIQLHLRAVLEVKHGPGDPYYREVREIEGRASRENRPLTPEEAARIDALNAESKPLFDEAYREAGGDPTVTKRPDDDGEPPAGPVSAGRTPPPPPDTPGGATRTPEPEPEPEPARGADREGSDATPAASGPPQQRTRDLDQIYADAAVADVELRGLADEIAGATGGEHKPPPGLKGRDRAEEKIAADYGGDASLICDLSRTTLEFESLADLRRAIAMLEARGVVVRKKDRFDQPKDSGYRDANLNVRMSNGHVCEIQLHLKAILDVKHGPGDELYRQIRAIEARAEIEGRPLTPEETARIDALTTESRDLFDEAYRSTGGGAPGRTGVAAAAETEESREQLGGVDEPPPQP